MRKSENTFSSRLKNLRIEKGLRQVDLARAAGVTSAAIGNYENGKREPGIDELILLADCLETTIDYLVGRVGEESREDDTLEQQPFTRMSC